MRVPVLYREPVARRGVSPGRGARGAAAVVSWCISHLEALLALPNFLQRLRQLPRRRRVGRRRLAVGRGAEV